MGTLKVEQDGVCIRLDGGDFIKMAEQNIYLGLMLYPVLYRYLAGVLPRGKLEKIKNRAIALMSMEIKFIDFSEEGGE